MTLDSKQIKLTSRMEPPWAGMPYNSSYYVKLIELSEKEYCLAAIVSIIFRHNILKSFLFFVDVACVIPITFAPFQFRLSFKRGLKERSHLLTIFTTDFLWMGAA